MILTSYKPYNERTFKSEPDCSEIPMYYDINRVKNERACFEQISNLIIYLEESNSTIMSSIQRLYWNLYKKLNPDYYI